MVREQVIGFYFAQVGDCEYIKNNSKPTCFLQERGLRKQLCFSILLLSTKPGIYSLYTLHFTLNIVSYPSEDKLDVIG